MLPASVLKVEGIIVQLILIKRAYVFIVSLLLFSLVGCNDKNEDIVANNVIPLPNNYVISSGAHFVVNNDIKVVLAENNDDIKLEALAQHFIAKLKEDFALEVTLVKKGELVNEDIIIRLHLAETFNNPEQYSLTINEQEVLISASGYQGIFYGTQTFYQLLNGRKENKSLPQLEIKDKPEFGYRGMMLDVSRHFFTTEEVKSMLDLMALYKFNTFHWHLTDDQGWRIEIKQYPLLTDIGSYRNETVLEKNFNPFIGDGIPHSGFYTQDDIKKIVKYAQDRYITIIPEIDLPGHMQSALAAYPELACAEGPFSVSTSWGVYSNLLCPSDETFTFLEDVFSEVFTLFPGEYIHIGGDEVLTKRWKESDVAQSFIQTNNLQNEDELQGYFYHRMETFLAANNRKAIGWDEIQEKSLKTPTTIMAWRGEDKAIKAVKSGHSVIMATPNYTYFNYYQGNKKSEPLAQCCYVPLEDVYQFDLMLEGVSASEQNLILGAQGNMWSEYIKTNQHLQYMMLPRMLALSEVLWSKKESRNIGSFKARLPTHFNYFDRLGINYRAVSH